MTTFDDILNNLKKKIYHPVVLLHGEESWYTDQITGYYEKSILSEPEREFNLAVYYGKDLSALSLLDVLKRYPMMSNYQVVILKEAQELKDTDPLIPYLENPLKSTIFVMAVSRKLLDRRLRLYKAFQKSGLVFESKKLYENQVPAWIKEYIAAKGHKISPHACELLTDHLGTDLSRMANEIDKLLINIPPGHAIDVTHVEKNTGISKDYNTFEYQNALGRRDVYNANRIARYFMDNPKAAPMVMILGTVYRFFSKVYLVHFLRNVKGSELASRLQVVPFFVKDYVNAARNYSRSETEEVIAALHEYDLKSKGVDHPAVNEGELLKEMTWKILHAGRVGV